MSSELFHPLVCDWFAERFGAATPPQRAGWPQIAAGRNTLIAAPTGSGKTLAAFLVCLDRLWRDWLEGNLDDGIRAVYVSPLKALSNDIQRNLQQPLAEIRELAAQRGYEPPPIRTAVRTGDTPSHVRQKMLRRPPHILVTTPESLYLLLTSEKSRKVLRSVDTVIVDEIHALARDKRGSHLSLSLERLTHLSDRPPLRIGLSATQRPIDEIARFLVGSECQEVKFVESARSERWDEDQSSTRYPALRTQYSVPSIQYSARDVFVVDAGHARSLDLAVEVPPSELSAVCSHEQWKEVYQRLVEQITSHRSTLIFVNTRRLAERISHHLRELLGDDAVAGHHGSLAKETRLSAEQRLKSGELKAIVATASLEMGIDIGYIDLVCQIGSPRSIAAFLQRVGRSGHSLGKTPKGRLFPLTRDELLEAMALVRAVHRGQLDRIEIPEAPLDILAQQIVAETSCQLWGEDELFELCRRAWPYRDLCRARFEEVLELLANGVSSASKRGVYLHRDRINRQVRARRGARLAALTSGGAIPETAEYRVVAEPEKTFVGTVDEDFAIESLAGDVFLLGNTSWRVQYVRAGEVVVRDAEGAPPNIPFWFGEGPARTIELSGEVSKLREDIAAMLRLCEEDEVVEAADCEAFNARRNHDSDVPHPSPLPKGEGTWNHALLKEQGTKELLQRECGVRDWAADQAMNYVESQVAALGLIPTKKQIVFERFFDESGGMQLVIHSPLGARINRAWGLALRKRFCRSFDFELQAAATDDGIVLSLSPQHSFPVTALFKMLGTHNARHLLEQAVLAAPMFQVRWRWNATRALAVLRSQAGKRIPPYLQRFRSDDLLAAAFPETVGCLENHHGDVQIPDHPLVRQTMHDCLTEAMDVDRWLGLLQAVQDGQIELIPRDTREPSPFCHELLNANPYAFLDGAPLEERRTRAVATRRTFTADDVRDLAKLNPEAIAQVRAEAWPVVRDANELHDALMSLVVLDSVEGHDWNEWFDELVASGRATVVSCNRQSFWIASERWPLVRAVVPEAKVAPPVKLPEELDQPVEPIQGRTELVRGQMSVRGPVTSAWLADQLGLEPGQVDASLEALEAQGTVLRGQFATPAAQTKKGTGPICRNGPEDAAHKLDPSFLSQWCDRRLLARIHRLTLEGLRARIKPVSPEDFIRFLCRRHRVGSGDSWSGPVGVREAIGQLQGFELPAGAWESRILAARCEDYDSQWLDHLFLSGEVTWGRLRPKKGTGPIRRNGAEDAAHKLAPSPISASKSNAAMSRAIAISLMLREDLLWLLPADRDAPVEGASSNAVAVREALEHRGALFFQELQAASGLLAGHVEEALRELAALGLITSDTFAAVRSLVNRRQNGRRGRSSQGASSSRAPVGRWSPFPGILAEQTHEQHVERWCRLLLRRYGVVFRDLLAREAAAPSWSHLVRTFRRLELRGDVRGGRFVSGVGGEQFADEKAVSELRSIREQSDDESWVVLSAVDPLNLSGIIVDGPRVTANQTNSLILQNGKCVAARQTGRIDFFHEFDRETEAALRRALQTGRPAPQSHVKQTWLDAVDKPRSKLVQSDNVSRTR